MSELPLLSDSMSLFSLDVLPPKCSIRAEARFDENWAISIRFCAVRPRRWRGSEQSEWSGWFAYEGEPIVLRWETFW